MSGAPHNAAGIHWKVIDLLIRILMPIMAIVLAALLTVVIANQAVLAQLSAEHEAFRQRFGNLESSLMIQPPADYRTYIDSKFAEVTRRLDELHSELQLHARSGQ